MKHDIEVDLARQLDRLDTLADLVDHEREPGRRQNLADDGAHRRGIVDDEHAAGPPDPRGRLQQPRGVVGLHRLRGDRVRFERRRRCVRQEYGEGRLGRRSRGGDNLRDRRVLERRIEKHQIDVAAEATAGGSGVVRVDRFDRNRRGRGRLANQITVAPQRRHRHYPQRKQIVDHAPTP